jgi:hypothetical protein
VFAELLGPLRYAADSHAPGAGAWAPLVLGVEKRGLLQEVLRDVSRNRANQRLVNEMNDILAGLQHTEGARL